MKCNVQQWREIVAVLSTQKCTFDTDLIVKLDNNDSLNIQQGLNRKNIQAQACDNI